MGVIVAILITSPFEVKALQGHPTFYCGCDQRDAAKAFRGACGYRPKSDTTRARRVEWEHVVPASFFGQTFRAWQGDKTCTTKGKAYKGRRCARKASLIFKAMELDPHNLVPAIGELNGVRGDKPYGVVPGEPRAFGACDFEVNGVVEPAPTIRGDIARIYFYMKSKYPAHMPLTSEMTATLKRWSKEDPVDRAECRRQRAAASQAPYTYNPFVERPCKAMSTTASTTR